MQLSVSTKGNSTNELCGIPFRFFLPYIHPAHLDGYSKSTFRSSTSPRQLSGAAPPRLPAPTPAPNHDAEVVAAAAAVRWGGGVGGGGAAPFGTRLINSKTLSAAPTAWVLHFRRKKRIE